MRNKSNPAASQYQALEMGVVRLGLWYFTNRLGMDFTLTLMLSLIYQLFVAFFIALRGMSNLPILSSLYNGSLVGQIGAVILSMILAALIQGLVVAEMAQVVWLRYPERLNIRLMSKSVWWYIITGALIVTLVFDFILLFMATTEQSNLFRAFSYVLSSNQFTGILVFLLSVLNFLTVLRCASVMRTSTAESTGRNLQEYLVGIAQDTLVTASDTVHHQTALLWKSLGISPDRLIPLHNSVIDFIVATHADKLPQQLPGSAWAYDWKGNRLVGVPRDVHAALVQNREYFSQPKLPVGKSAGNDNKPLDVAGDNKQTLNPSDVFWKMSAQEQVDLINLNLATIGRPDVVDATDPTKVTYITPALNSRSHSISQNTGGNGGNPREITTPPSAQTQPAPSQSTARPTQSQDKTSAKLPERLSQAEKELFSEYLLAYYAQEFDEEFDSAEGSIFTFFDEAELEELYLEWKETDPEASFTPGDPSQD